MPTFNFSNNETGEVIQKFMTNSEREAFLAENPEWTQTLAAPAIVDPIRIGVTRTPDHFNDTLKYIAQRNSKGRNQSKINYR